MQDAPAGVRDRWGKNKSGYGRGKRADSVPRPDNSLTAALGDAGAETSEDRGSTPRTSTGTLRVPCESGFAGLVRVRRSRGLVVLWGCVGPCDEPVGEGQ